MQISSTCRKLPIFSFQYYKIWLNKACNLQEKKRKQNSHKKIYHLVAGHWDVNSGFRLGIFHNAGINCIQPPLPYRKIGPPPKWPNTKRRTTKVRTATRFGRKTQKGDLMLFLILDTKIQPRNTIQRRSDQCSISNSHELSSPKKHKTLKWCNWSDWSDQLQCRIFLNWGFHKRCIGENLWSWKNFDSATIKKIEKLREKSEKTRKKIDRVEAEEEEKENSIAWKNVK